MFPFSKKTITVPTEETQKLTAMEVWSVRWDSRYGDYSGNVRRECEFFTTREDAQIFKKSLEDAFALIRHTHGNSVEIKKEK